MIVVRAPSADNAWRDLVSKFRECSRTQVGRDQPTKELLHVAVEIEDPRQRIVFSRAVNPAFAIAEVIWILAGADDVGFLGFWNPRMRKYSDDGVRLCGAYGYRMGSQPRLDPVLAKKLRHWTRFENASPTDQLRSAYEALRHTPATRQAVVQIWDAKFDLPNPASRSRDVPCNLIGHMMIRDGRLEWLQTMRSNDFIWGFPYNIIQFTTIQEIMAGWLGIRLGSYVHISDSLHVYQRHWKDLDAVNIQSVHEFPRNTSDLGISSYDSWETVFSRVVELSCRLTTASSVEALTSVLEEGSTLPPAYGEWVALLTAEALRKRGHVGLALRASEASGAFLQMSWKQWMLHAESRKKVTAPISVLKAHTPGFD
jgi:thymidylate synthase